MARAVDLGTIDPRLILPARVAILGYGNQGHAHALNLRDQGVEVVVGARPGRSWDRAVADGFAPVSLAQAATADFVMLSLPDQHIPRLYREEIAESLRPGSILLFAHGFNVVFDLIELPPDVDVAMVSPKGAGYGVRADFLAGPGRPALVAVAQDVSGQALGRALAYAWGIGCARRLILETTFREETVTDLFGEQAVLCGGIPSLIQSAVATLVEAGYSPEVAYLECLHETKLIVDLIVAKGIAGMRESISDTAAYGGLVIGPRLIDDEMRTKLRGVLQEIESGQFARQWVSEIDSGGADYQRRRDAEAQDGSEPVGAEMRPKIL